MTDYNSSINLKDIITAQILSHRKQLFESSLSRIMAHAKESKEKGFAILTSWRKSNSGNENKTNFQGLQDYVKARGWGYTRLRGHWRECQDLNIPYDQCPASELKDVIEPSIMVFGIDLETAKKLGNKYNQDSVVYAGPETDGQTQLIFGDGSVEVLGDFNPMAIGQAYSDYRHRNQPAEKNTKENGKKKKTPPVERWFKFEGFSYPAQTFVESLAEETLRKKLKILTEASEALPTWKKP